MRLSALMILLAHASIASAQGVEPPGDQASWLARAEDLEDANDPRGALDAWQHAVDALPGARLASRARQRVEWIAARAEGDFGPLASLMRFTSLPRRARVEAVIADFETQIGSMPEGRVRIEARLAVAGDWARVEETDRALAAWRLLLDERTLEASERELVHESMARAQMDAGDAAGALAELEDAHLGDTGLHQIAARSQRAAILVPVAWSVLLAFAIAAGAAVLIHGRGRRVVRAALTRSRLVLAIWIGGVPWLIARSWADESSAAFLAAGSAMSLIVLTSFILGEALAGSRWRGPAAALAVLASFAAAYLAVVHRGDALPFA